MNIENPDHQISDIELLARFILFSSWIRHDRTVKPDAFMPHPRHLDISVTRHDRLSEQEIWELGASVASRSEKTMHGHADVSAASARRNSLGLRPDPTPDNPNHACIFGWPNEKAAQKSIAQRLAAASTLHGK